MSKTISYSDSISAHPTSYDSDYSAYSVSGLDQGETDSSSTNYATINLTRNSGAITQIFYNFNLNIPTSATITSVSCTAKCYISTTNSSRITTRQIQLFSGSTAKGTAYTVANSTTAFTISAESFGSSVVHRTCTTPVCETEPAERVAAIISAFIPGYCGANLPAIASMTLLLLITTIYVSISCTAESKSVVFVY